jgi:hypothetical protein
MKLAFLNTDVISLCMAHEILDGLDCEIHFFSESAEIGMFGEGPGIISKWPIMPIHWLSSLHSQKPNKNSNAVRRSWLSKAISISLAERDCIFHLRTRITKKTNTFVEFVGAGKSGAGRINFDEIFFIIEEPSIEKWLGGITVENIIDTTRLIIGTRPDTTKEVWYRKPLSKKINWIQEMSWKGKTPEDSVESDINQGIQKARDFLNKITYV